MLRLYTGPQQLDNCVKPSNEQTLLLDSSHDATDQGKEFTIQMQAQTKNLFIIMTVSVIFLQMHWNMSPVDSSDSSLESDVSNVRQNQLVGTQEHPEVINKPRRKNDVQKHR